MAYKYSALAEAAFTFPAIDNHTHPLLKEEYRNVFPFEGLVSEATGTALTEDAIETLACYRATKQLAKLFQCSDSWNDVKSARGKMDYMKLCRICMEPTGIQCVLLDDGLDGENGRCESFEWHNQFTSSPSKRIVRIEVAAQTIIRELINLLDDINHMSSQADELLSTFMPTFSEFLFHSARDENVVGFKSIACYRTGLDISVSATDDEVVASLAVALADYQKTGKLRLAHKQFNDALVRTTLEVAGLFRKPVQFHTGLGDNDIDLVMSNPAYMQPIIKAFPNATFVLLHSSYPFTREAGYLTSVYKNVYLDFGEVFPFVSAEGQRAVVRQVLELCPTNKIMWSTDGHWWPETYYLGTLQGREALFEVLSEIVAKQDLSEAQAVSIVQDALFHNANKVYNLRLTPYLTVSKSIPASPSGLLSLIDSGIKHIRIQWVDLANIPRLHVLPIERFKAMAASSQSGIILDNASLSPSSGLSKVEAAGFYHYRPDMSSLRICGYAAGHASVLGWFEEKAFMDDTLRRVLLCPRSLLDNTIKRAKDNRGVNFLIGFETQFTLLERTSPPEAANEHGWSCSSALPSGSIVSAVLNDIATALATADVELLEYYSDCGLGQYNVVVGHLQPMKAVDALITTRETIFNIANMHGLKATLSPHVFHDEPGNMSRIRISLTSSKTSSLAKEANTPGLTTCEASFMQGLLDHLPSVSAFSRPLPGSYTPSGDSNTSDTYVCWGIDDRAYPVRLCHSAGRGYNFELRILDGTANPYVALAAILMSGILGMEKGEGLQMKECRTLPAELQEEQRRNLNIDRKMPSSIEDARQALEGDDVLCKALGMAFVEHYVDLNKRLAKEFPPGNLTRLIETY